MHDAWLFPFRDRDLIVPRDGAALLTVGAWIERGLPIGELHPVGEWGGVAALATFVAHDFEHGASHAHGLRLLWGRLDEKAWQLAGKAVQILAWDRDHAFCGRCGGPTERKLNERARACPTCRLDFFPRLAPVVIVRVTRGDEILLARSPHFTPGVYSVLAGFVEPGESLEAAAHREIKEEVGIEVENLRYASSEPWPFPNSLMIGFVADWKAGEIRIQEGEIEDARFFKVGELPKLPASFSISRRLIDAWLAGA